MGSICVVGTDETIVTDVLRTKVDGLLGDLDPSLALEEFDGDDAGDDFSARVGAALGTPPFLVDRRIVVVRNADALTADEAETLTKWMESPTESVTLVLSVVGAKSAKLAKAADEVVETNPGRNDGGKATFIKSKFEDYRLNATGGVIAEIAKTLGEEMSRVDGLARTLQAIYGTSPLTWEQVAPYIGELGDVAPWDLTNAIEAGDTVTAITMVRRMLDSGQRAGMQILASLRNYYLELAFLHGSPAKTKDQAAEMLGRHSFPAGKQLQFANRLGHKRIQECVSLITQAELDLKGGMSFGGNDLTTNQDPTELTIFEVLVARLARHGLAASRQ
jgi:DNA polymerase III delta subunit